MTELAVIDVEQCEGCAFVQRIAPSAKCVRCAPPPVRVQREPEPEVREVIVAPVRVPRLTAAKLRGQCFVSNDWVSNGHWAIHKDALCDQDRYTFSDMDRIRLKHGKIHIERLSEESVASMLRQRRDTWFERSPVRVDSGAVTMRFFEAKGGEILALNEEYADMFPTRVLADRLDPKAVFGVTEAGYPWIVAMAMLYGEGDELLFTRFRR